MAITTLVQGARSAALVTMGSLANGNYIASANIDLGAAIPLDVTVEVEATPSAATSGLQQVVVFAKLSLDNTNYGSGPESGSTTTNEADLIPIGTLPCRDTSTHRKHFSLSGIPTARYLRIVVKNETGVALSNGFVYRADITGDVT